MPLHDVVVALAMPLQMQHLSKVRMPRHPSAVLEPRVLERRAGFRVSAWGWMRRDCRRCRLGCWWSPNAGICCGHGSVDGRGQLLYCGGWASQFRAGWGSGVFVLVGASCVLARPGWWSRRRACWLEVGYAAQTGGSNAQMLQMRFGCWLVGRWVADKVAVVCWLAEGMAEAQWLVGWLVGMWILGAHFR
jgi:hypothetical protein